MNLVERCKYLNLNTTLGKYSIGYNITDSKGFVFDGEKFSYPEHAKNFKTIKEAKEEIKLLSENNSNLKIEKLITYVKNEHVR